jgi:hypothetical protein
MALFMDHHEDLKLPAEVLAQIAEDTRRCHRSGEAQRYASPAGTSSSSSSAGSSASSLISPSASSLASRAS